MTVTPTRSTPARRLARALVTLAVVGLVVAGGCVPTGERPHFADETNDNAAGTSAPDSGGDAGSGVSCAPAGEQFEGFTTAPIAINDAAGVLVQCVLVADTNDLRQRGLSGVPDTGGHAGMIFAFAEDTTGSFWMANTHMPLTIAFIDSSGRPVSVLDMEPCPDAVDCPSYFPDEPYRWALEVPQGQLAQFGLSDGATLDPETLPRASG